jgi:hypothetical protein
VTTHPVDYTNATEHANTTETSNVKLPLPTADSITFGNGLGIVSRKGGDGGDGGDGTTSGGSHPVDGYASIGATVSPKNSATIGQAAFVLAVNHAMGNLAGKLYRAVSDYLAPSSERASTEKTKTE